MKRKNLSNHGLAKIERSLFKSVQQNKTDLDEVFDSSDLFINIKRKIHLKQSVIITNKRHLWLVEYGFASVLIVSFLLISAFYFVNFPSIVVDESVSITQSENGFQPIHEKAQPTSENTPQRFVENKKTKSINRPQMIAKETRKSPLKPTLNKKPKPRIEKPSIENNSPFYALNGINNLDFQNEGISVVRTDFSREELSAMGIEVLNDIGNFRIKAEVLVGDDGQPRAIRILK